MALLFNLHHYTDTMVNHSLKIGHAQQPASPELENSLNYPEKECF